MPLEADPSRVGARWRENLPVFVGSGLDIHKVDGNARPGISMHILANSDHASPINTGAMLLKPSRYLYRDGLRVLDACELNRSHGWGFAGRPRDIMRGVGFNGMVGLQSNGSVTTASVDIGGAAVASRNRQWLQAGAGFASNTASTATATVGSEDSSSMEKVTTPMLWTPRYFDRSSGGSTTQLASKDPRLLTRPGTPRHSSPWTILALERNLGLFLRSPAAALWPIPAALLLALLLRDPPCVPVARTPSCHRRAPLLHKRLALEAVLSAAADDRGLQEE